MVSWLTLVVSLKDTGALLGTIKYSYCGNKEVTLNEYDRRYTPAGCLNRHELKWAETNREKKDVTDRINRARNEVAPAGGGQGGH